MPTAYTVRATFADLPLLNEYVAWLKDEHIGQVLEAGACSAEVINLSDVGSGAQSVCCVEIRYLFESPPALKNYLEHHAPRLRQAGMTRFPPEQGIVFVRTVGEVVFSASRADKST